MQLAATTQRLRLTVPSAWLDQHPLSEADLEQEQAPLNELGLLLEVHPS
jgi:exopolyphosphatase/guanosine-5'-triphosphate,3'-diphosphate pyrophosphatase